MEILLEVKEWLGLLVAVLVLIVLPKLIDKKLGGPTDEEKKLSEEWRSQAWRDRIRAELAEKEMGS